MDDENHSPSHITLLKKLSAVGQEQLNKGNLRKAKTAFEYAYNTAKLSDHKEYQNSLLLNLASTYIAAQKPDSAVSCLKAALNFELSSETLGDLHHNLAIAFDMLSNLGEASKEYDLALSAYTLSDASPDIIANLAIKNGVSYMKLGKYKKAIVSFNNSAYTLSQRELIPQLATVLCMKARCLIKSDATASDAVQVCEECLKLCKSMEQDLFTVNLYNELGLILTQSKEYKRSAECYKLALAVAEEYADEPTWSVKLAALLQNLGAVLNSTRRYREAINYSQRAADIYGLFGVRSSQCHCFLNMAFSFSQLKSVSATEKCEEYYLHAYQAAKDTGCLRDQWQSLEGLAGVTLIKRRTDKAIDYYQKAIGICAAIGSNRHEQDRLVKKLSTSLRRIFPQYAINGHGGGVQANRSQGLVLALPTINDPILPSPTPSASDSLAYSQLNHRPANEEASRSLSVIKAEVELVNESISGSVRKSKKRRRVRKLSSGSNISRVSRRSDQEPHPVHGVHESIHKGLGTYRSQEDHTRHNHLSPEDIVHKGRRRHRMDDASSIGSGGLHIKGLAVTLDDPGEPGVAAANKHDTVDYDEIDSADIVQVRPMSRQVMHRRSAILNFFSDDSESVEESRSYSGESVTYGYDQCPDSDSDSYPGIDVTRAAENQAYGRIVHGVNEQSEDRPKSAATGRRKMTDKGKRPQSGKVLVRKLSKVMTQSSEEQGIYAMPISHKLSLLETGSALESEDDREAMKENMRQLSNLESSDSEIKTDDDVGKQQLDTNGRTSTDKRNSLTSVSSSDDKELGTGDGEEDVEEEESMGDTYLKAVEDPVDGGNFFKKKHRPLEDPIYETMPTALNSAPAQTAPTPPLPKRNSEEKRTRFNLSNVEGSDSEPDVSKMTRGERESFLFEQQKMQQGSVKVVTWEKTYERTTKKKTKEKMPKSGVCSVM